MNTKVSSFSNLLLTVTGLVFALLFTFPARAETAFKVTGLCGDSTCPEVLKHLRQTSPEQMAEFEAICKKLPTAGSMDKELNLAVGRFVPDEDPEYVVNMVKIECITWDGKYGPEVEANDYYPVPNYLGALQYYP